LIVAGLGRRKSAETVGANGKAASSHFHPPPHRHRSAPMKYDFEVEARLVCNAIGSTNGNMTVQCALREAFAAGQEASAPVLSAPEGARSVKWTDEQEVEAVKQQLPDGAWKRGASLARCVEDLRMERDLYCGTLVGLLPICDGQAS